MQPAIKLIIIIQPILCWHIKYPNSICKRISFIRHPEIIKIITPAVSYKPCTIIWRLCSCRKIILGIIIVPTHNHNCMSTTWAYNSLHIIIWIIKVVLSCIIMSIACTNSTMLHDLLLNNIRLLLNINSVCILQMCHIVIISIFVIKTIIIYCLGISIWNIWFIDSSYPLAESLYCILVVTTLFQIWHVGIIIIILRIIPFGSTERINNWVKCKMYKLQFTQVNTRISLTLSYKVKFFKSYRRECPTCSIRILISWWVFLLIWRNILWVCRWYISLCICCNIRYIYRSITIKTTWYVTSYIRRIHRLYLLRIIFCVNCVSIYSHISNRTCNKKCT